MRSRIAAALVLGACLPLSAAAAQPPPAAPVEREEALPGLGAALAGLRQGGYVLYFRHGLTDQGGADDAEADLTRCETQRNLSAAGRQQATAIGQAFKALGIPVGEVWASPFCRCKDTAQLAFGRFTVNRDLYFALQVDAAERAQLAGVLRRLLGGSPERGNTVIVAHTANLKEAAGLWPKPEGVAFVFRPLGGERPDLDHAHLAPGRAAATPAVPDRAGPGAGADRRSHRRLPL